MQKAERSRHGGRPARDAPPTRAACHAAALAAIDDLAPTDCEEVRAAERSAAGCCYDCGRALDGAKQLEQLLICGHCGELVHPSEAIRGRRAQLRIALAPQHSNSADRGRQHGPPSRGQGFRSRFRPLWVHVALGLYETDAVVTADAPLAGLSILAEASGGGRDRRYWSREIGWASLAIATTFTATERDEAVKAWPIAGEWCEFAAGA